MAEEYIDLYWKQNLINTINKEPRCTLGWPKWTYAISWEKFVSWQSNDMITGFGVR